MNIGPVKRGVIVGGALFFGMLAFSWTTLHAAEETAHITLEKSKSVKKRDSYPHKIKRGDTLHAIVTAIFNPPSMKTREQIYKSVRQLNPRMTSIHKIYSGQIIQLPDNQKFSSSTAAMSPQNAGAPEGIEASAPASPPLPSDYRMAVIREVITRMRGTMITAGNYYIPLPESGQITIDCARIPLVELPDGSVILLDFSQRMPTSLKKTLREYWPNYHLLTINPHDESPKILQKVMQASRTYSMSKILKPIHIGKAPELQVTPGWLITERSGRKEKKAIQLITYINDRQRLFPKEFTDAVKRSGLIITEVLRGQGVVNPPEIQPAALSVPELKSSTNLDVCLQLLQMLNLEPSRNADMKIFVKEQSGFNLSINADLLVTRDNKRTIFKANPLPSQFFDILRENGVETVILTQADSRRAIIEKTLAGLQIPFSATVFSFPLSEQAGVPRGVIRFPAMRIAVNQSFLYLVDFDMDQDLYQHLHKQWGVNLIKY